jgi:hypothetical protein
LIIKSTDLVFVGQILSLDNILLILVEHEAFFREKNMKFFSQVNFLLIVEFEAFLQSSFFIYFFRRKTIALMTLLILEPTLDKTLFNKPFSILTLFLVKIDEALPNLYVTQMICLDLINFNQ